MKRLSRSRGGPTVILGGGRRLNGTWLINTEAGQFTIASCSHVRKLSLVSKDLEKQLIWSLTIVIHP